MADQPTALPAITPTLWNRGKAECLCHSKTSPETLHYGQSNCAEMGDSGRRGASDRRRENIRQREGEGKKEIRASKQRRVGDVRWEHFTRSVHSASGQASSTDTQWPPRSAPCNQPSPYLQSQA